MFFRSRFKANAVRPVGVVLLPRKYGTLSSSLYTRQRIRNQHSYRPTIPRAHHLWVLSHTRLRFAARGVNLSWLRFRVPCKLFHQLRPGQSTRHH